MYITAFFTDSGVPKTGLSATIRVRDLSDNSLVVTDAAMTEVGDGFYKYDFTTYDPDKDYAIRCDGSVTLSDAERYTFAGNENYLEDIERVGGMLELSSNDLKRLLGLSHENVYMDNPSYDSDDNLVAVRVRIYSVAGSVGTSNDVIGTYLVSSAGAGAGKFTTWQQVKV